MGRVVSFYKSKTSDDVKRSIHQIIHNLESKGYAITHNSGAPKVLARRFDKEKKNGLIKFSWCKEDHSSIIALGYGVKLEKVGNNSARIVSKSDVPKIIKENVEDKLRSNFFNENRVA